MRSMGEGHECYYIVFVRVLVEKELKFYFDITVILSNTYVKVYRVFFFIDDGMIYILNDNSFV